MVNTEKLKEEVKHFKFNSKPSSGNSQDHCTVGDINKVVDNVTKLFNTFIKELEEN